jgi:hypothetical protein
MQLNGGISDYAKYLLAGQRRLRENRQNGRHGLSALP